MIRKGRKYDLNEVLPFVVFRSSGTRKSYDGDDIKMSTDCLKLFSRKGVKCVKCGIEGQYFVKEKSSKQDPTFHFNLYAVNPAGSEVLMTKDHILSQRDFGKNSLGNYQTMCSLCNLTKGAELVEASKIVQDSLEMVQGPMGRLLKALLRQQHRCLAEHRGLSADAIISKMARGCGIPEEQIQIVLDWSVETRCKG